VVEALGPHAEMVGVDGQEGNGGFPPHAGPTDAQSVYECRLVVVCRTEEVDRHVSDVVGRYDGRQLTAAVADQFSALHDSCLLVGSRSTGLGRLAEELLGWS
jgi:hypothetical protein